MRGLGTKKWKGLGSLPLLSRLWLGVRLSEELGSQPQGLWGDADGLFWDPLVGGSPGEKQSPARRAGSLHAGGEKSGG